MTFTQDTQKSVLDPDADTSTIYTAMTPPSTIIDSDNHDDDDKNLNDNKDDDNDKNNDKTSHASSSIPWPGSTFLIRASSSGKLLTLDTGNVILARPGTNGPSIHVSILSHLDLLYTKTLLAVEMHRSERLASFPERRFRLLSRPCFLGWYNLCCNKSRWMGEIYCKTQT